MTRASQHSRAVVIALVLIAVAPATCAKDPGDKPSVPDGMQINVRMKDKLRSDKAKVGDQFRGTLESPLVVNGRVMYSKGTEVMGYVVRSHASARGNDPGVLELDLLGIGKGTDVAPLTAKTLVLKAESARQRDMVVDSKAVLTWITVDPAARPNWATNAPKDVRHGAGAPFRILGHPELANAAPEQGARYTFSDQDRVILRACFSQPGARVRPVSARKGQLTPAAAKQLQRNRTLSPELQRQVQPLPTTCARKLSRLPTQWTRGAVGGRVILLAPDARIADVFIVAAGV